MAVKMQLKLCCLKLACRHQHILQRMLTQTPRCLSDCYPGVQNYNYQVGPTSGTSCLYTRRYFAKNALRNENSDSKRSVFDIKLDVQKGEDTGQEVSLPLLMYFYGPWQQLNTKWNFWKLKLLWDWSFVESNFMLNSQQAAVVVIDFVRNQLKERIERCTTPLGFKQISQDLFHDWRIKLMRFEQRHICRAIPLKVQMLSHYDHKFAFVDVIFIALRHIDDFKEFEEKREIQSFIDKYSKDLRHENPLVFSEIFVRFRRDYSVEKNSYGGQWLISSYRILNFDFIKNHPEFDVKPYSDMLPSYDDIH